MFICLAGVDMSHHTAISFAISVSFQNINGTADETSMIEYPFSSLILRLTVESTVTTSVSETVQRIRSICDDAVSYSTYFRGRNIDHSLIKSMRGIIGVNVKYHDQLVQLPLNHINTSQ